MKCHNMAVYLIIPLALFSIMSLFDNVQAQTNSSSTNQTTSQQQQQMNMTAQALMQTDIVGIKDTLAKAKLEIIQDNLQEAEQDVKNVEEQLEEIELSPNKLSSNINKTLKAIDKSNIDKALDTLTRIQITILKAENQIFKTAVANPQVMQQFINIEKTTNEDEYTQIEEDYADTMQDYTKIEEDYADTMQQFNNMETNTNEEDYTDIGDT